jgi:two-component system, NarL family, response regulator DevR
MVTRLRDAPVALEDGEAMADRPPVRVFILDDHEMLRRGLRTMLEEAGGFEIAGEAASAAEALQLLGSARPDVALLDVQLPDGSGIEVCRQVRTLHPQIRTLMVTTYDDDEARLAAALAGAAGFVTKQIRGATLVDAVRRVAAGETLLDDAASADAVRRARERRTDPRMASLTGQETRVLNLIADGLTNRQIGERLSIGEKTVKNYVTSVLLKLGMSRRTQAAVFGAQQRGF